MYVSTIEQQLALPHFQNRVIQYLCLTVFQFPSKCCHFPCTSEVTSFESSLRQSSSARRQTQFSRQVDQRDCPSIFFDRHAIHFQRKGVSISVHLNGHLWLV